ncbi:MAG: UDP-N-acetylglucosamine 2-epimerase (non-hydrolyzing) [Bacteroidetes bacterium]|nr:UDP-N-acetylglucosamine 2-epimerase (non-hydrolyzing) [Bacteroidota bacterium]
MKKVLFLFGTRPEAIKLAPLVSVFKNSKKFSVKVCVTAQHREMLDQVLSFFEIKPDYDLNIMSPGQTLPTLTAALIQKITDEVLLKESFDYVFVQGDTSTVMAGSIAAYYQKISVVHIEAGLRSGNIYSPFPEEMNRILTSKISEFHFCPTSTAEENLHKEGITKNIFVVGNTVIDALLAGIKKVDSMDQNLFFKHFPTVDFNKKIILLTCHRRESFGEPFKDICKAVNEIAATYPDMEIVYPVHLNPNIKENAHKYLTQPNIKLIAPLDYPYLIWLLNKSYLVLTDSGGIQEEAPSLGKPVLVLREVTERMEGVEAGTAKLVGTDTQKIVSETKKLIEDVGYYSSVANSVNPYGDGTTSEKILEILPA